MRILTFGMTRQAFLAGHKSVTRRKWAPRQIAQWKAELAKPVPFLVQAYDKSARHSGKQIAKLKILSVEQEDNRNIPFSDWQAEGFEYMDKHGLSLKPGMSCRQLWDEWDQLLPSDVQTVIRFELVNVTEPKQSCLAGWA